MQDHHCWKYCDNDRVEHARSSSVFHLTSFPSNVLPGSFGLSRPLKLVLRSNPLIRESRWDYPTEQPQSLLCTKSSSFWHVLCSVIKEQCATGDTNTSTYLAWTSDVGMTPQQKITVAANKTGNTLIKTQLYKYCNNILMNETCFFSVKTTFLWHLWV